MQEIMQIVYNSRSLDIFEQQMLNIERIKRKQQQLNDCDQFDYNMFQTLLQISHRILCLKSYCNNQKSYIQIENVLFQVEIIEQMFGLIKTEDKWEIYLEIEKWIYLFSQIQQLIEDVNDDELVSDFLERLDVQ